MTAQDGMTWNTWEKYVHEDRVVSVLRMTDSFRMSTLEGEEMRGGVGDYLVTEASGNRYVVSPQVFESEFRRVQEEDLS